MDNQAEKIFAMDAFLDFVHRHPAAGYLVLDLHLAGSRSYGYAKPDSDYELVGVYNYPLQRSVSLSPAPKSFEQVYEYDGKRIELKMYELLEVCRNAAKGSKPTIEIFTGPEIYSLNAGYKDLLLQNFPALSMLNHYRGYARGQFGSWSGTGNIKSMLSAYRCLATAIALVETGRPNVSLVENLNHLPLWVRPSIEELISLRAETNTAYAEKWIHIYEALLSYLEDSILMSGLREECSLKDLEQLDEWIWRFKLLGSVVEINKVINAD